MSETQSEPWPAPPATCPRAAGTGRPPAKTAELVTAPCRVVNGHCGGTEPADDGQGPARGPGPVQLPADRRGPQKYQIDRTVLVHARPHPDLPRSRPAWQRQQNTVMTPVADGAPGPPGRPSEPVPVAFLGRTSTLEMQDPRASLRRQIRSSQAWLPPDWLIAAVYWDVESGGLDLEARSQGEAYRAFADAGIPRDGGMADLLAEAASPVSKFAAVICEDIERSGRDAAPDCSPPPTRPRPPNATPRPRAYRPGSSGSRPARTPASWNSRNSPPTRPTPPPRCAAGSAPGSPSSTANASRRNPAGRPGQDQPPGRRPDPARPAADAWRHPAGPDPGAES